VIPEVAERLPAEESPDARLDCDLACAGIAVKTAVTTNASNIARRIIPLEGLLSDWPTRHLAAPPQLTNKNCDSELHLYDRIVSPRFEIGSASHTLATRRSNTYCDVFRMQASSDAHICSESQDVLVCAPFATPNYRPFSSFPEVSNTDQTASLNPSDDGQRMMVIAANHGLFSFDRLSHFAQLAAQVPRNYFRGLLSPSHCIQRDERGCHNHRAHGFGPLALRLLIHWPHILNPARSDDVFPGVTFLNMHRPVKESASNEVAF
jgi:hypothetical protein